MQVPYETSTYVMATSRLPPGHSVLKDAPHVTRGVAEMHYPRHIPCRQRVRSKNLLSQRLSPFSLLKCLLLWRQV